MVEAHLNAGLIQAQFSYFKTQAEGRQALKPDNSLKANFQPSQLRHCTWQTSLLREQNGSMRCASLSHNYFGRKVVRIEHAPSIPILQLQSKDRGTFTKETWPFPIWTLTISTDKGLTCQIQGILFPDFKELSAFCCCCFL